jgi:hypothetical protein
MLLLYSSAAGGDYMTSFDPNEGDDFSLGYDLVEELGPVASNPVAGGQAEYRYYRARPLRHYTSNSPNDAPEGFQPDDTFFVGYACPAE